MTIQELLKSSVFLRFCDEDLYKNAEAIVGDLFQEIEKKPISRSQIKGIEMAIVQGGIRNLKNHSDHQYEKARKRVKEEKESDETIFWQRVKYVIENNQPNTFCLRKTATNLLEKYDLMPTNKKEKRMAIGEIVESLGVCFFEHFCCDYYYRENLFESKKGGKR